jgi:hypothetical protein
MPKKKKGKKSRAQMLQAEENPAAPDSDTMPSAAAAVPAPAVAGFYSDQRTPGQEKGLNQGVAKGLDPDEITQMLKSFKGVTISGGVGQEKSFDSIEASIEAMVERLARKQQPIYESISNQQIMNFTGSYTEYDLWKSPYFKKYNSHTKEEKKELLFTIKFKEPRWAIDLHKGGLDTVKGRELIQNSIETKYDYQWLHSTLKNHIFIILLGDDEDGNRKRKEIILKDSEGNPAPDKHAPLRAKGWVNALTYSGYFNTIKDDIIYDSGGNRICSVLAFVFDIIYNLTKYQGEISVKCPSRSPCVPGEILDVDVPSIGGGGYQLCVQIPQGAKPNQYFTVPKARITKEFLKFPNNQMDMHPWSYPPPDPTCSIILNYLITMATELVICGDDNKPHITKEEYGEVLRNYKTAAAAAAAAEDSQFLDFLNILDNLLFKQDGVRVLAAIFREPEPETETDEEEAVQVELPGQIPVTEPEPELDRETMDRYISAILDSLFKHEGDQVPAVAAPFVKKPKKPKRSKKNQGAAKSREPEPETETDEGEAVRVELPGQIPAAESEPELDTRTVEELERLYDETSSKTMYGAETFSSMVPDNKLSEGDAILVSTKIFHFLKEKSLTDVLGKELAKYFSGAAGTTGATGGAVQYSNKVFWIALIMFILIIFANDPTYNNKFMVKGGVSLILNTQGEVSVGSIDTPNIDTSDIDIALKPEEGKELPVISFNLAVTVLLTGHLLLINGNNFNIGLNRVELRKYMELNYSDWITADEKEIKLVQIGKKSTVEGVPDEYICDLVIENKPFIESRLLSFKNPLDSELLEGIMSHFGFADSFYYFQYRSLEGNISEYDNMMKTMFSLANDLLSETDPKKFRSILYNYSNINFKLPKLKDRLMGFGETLSRKDIALRLIEIEYENSYDERLKALDRKIRKKLREFRRATGATAALKPKKHKSKKHKSKKHKSKKRKSKKHKSKKYKSKRRKTRRKSKR